MYPEILFAYPACERLVVDKPESLTLMARKSNLVGVGFRGLGFRVLGFGVWGLGFRGLGFRGLGFGV